MFLPHGTLRIALEETVNVRLLNNFPSIRRRSEETEPAPLLLPQSLTAVVFLCLTLLHGLLLLLLLGLLLLFSLLLLGLLMLRLLPLRMPLQLSLLRRLRELPVPSLLLLSVKQLLLLLHALRPVVGASFLGWASCGIARLSIPDRPAAF